MPERTITFAEAAQVRSLARLLDTGLQYGLMPSWQQHWERAVDALIRTARPDLVDAGETAGATVQAPVPAIPIGFGAATASWPDFGAKALRDWNFGATPDEVLAMVTAPNPDADLSPRVPVERAAEDTSSPSGGALITEEGLADALHQMWADIGEGHFQPSQHDWPGDAHAYLMRHLARQDEITPSSISVGNFIFDKCKIGEGIEFRVRKQILFDAYREWCDQAKCVGMRAAEFDREMRSRGFKDKHSNGAWWTGIELITAKAFSK